MDKKTEQAEQEPAAVYGFCPICGREGVSRERGFNGNDTCVTGHRYASSEAILDFPQPVQEPVKQEPVAYISDKGALEPTLHGVVTLKNGDLLYAAPQPVQEPVHEALQIASVALQDIACSSQTENLYWWQLRARKAQKQIAERLINAAPVQPVQEPVAWSISQ